jgi:hypothetical protein
MICFGHGEPLRGAERFAVFVQTLRTDSPPES